MRQVKLLLNKKLERIIQNDPELAENSEIDNNNIMLILMISYFFKTFKLVIIILTVSYFIGIFWFIFCDLTKSTFPPDFDLTQLEGVKRQDVGFIYHF